MHMRYSWIQQLIIAAVIATAGSAQARPAQQQAVRSERSTKPATRPLGTAPCEDKRPWYCGVSEEDRRQALELYVQANQLFDDGLFTAAEKQYRAALVFWKHPGIHYNLMLALVTLEQPIKAYEASIEALRYGVKALKAEEYRRAVDYQRLLRKSIATLTVTCDEPGALVTLNGKEILHGPNTVQLLVLPGKHELVARKEGYLTTHHSLVAVAQQPARVQMRILPQEMAMLSFRRWPAWKPWALIGAGVGVGLAGGLLEWRADVNNRSLKSLIDKKCGDHDDDGWVPACLDHDGEIGSRQARYTWYRRVGHGASLAGGMALLGGIVLTYLNRERHMENPVRHDLIRVSAFPYLSPDTQGLAIDVSF